MFKLVIQDDEGKTTVVPLIRDELTIGRKEGNTIRLTERNVSRRHARVIRSNGSITIEDLESYNGIRVNGSRIQGKASLRESDRVQIGDYLIEIKSEAQDKDSNEATQPIERVDPLGNTPVPDASLTGAVTMPTPSPIHDLDGAATQPVPTVIPVQDTIKMPEQEIAAAMAAATASQPAVQTAGHARLIVLSTNYAGREFELDKPAMVIGRTDDNDIWINHRSISRHHAKIVRENGRYAIVDLQSSNGVRVNGEEYGKVELRRADVIDLGHVRMRFVEPGEDFVFGRDAQAMDVEPERRSRAALWAVLALLVMAAAGAVFYVWRGQSMSANAGEDDEATASNHQAASVREATASADAAPAVAQEPPPTEPPPTEPTTSDAAAHIKSAEDAIAAEQWTAAHEEAGKALAIDPTSARAEELRRQAKSELAAELVYKDFERCSRTDYRCIITMFEKMDPLSVYRDKAQEKFNLARETFTRERVGAARKLASKGKCDDIKKLAASSDAFWEEARDAVLAVRCDASVAQTKATPPPDDPEPRKPPPPEEPAVTPEQPDPVDSAAQEKEFNDTLAEAQSAAKQSHYGKALRLCEKALGIRKSQEATVICGIASCNLRSEPKAKKYISRIRSTSYKSMVRQICLRNGVKIP